ncbi:uncharacterized protein LOC123702874 [Colias croceus]|uniref:uncharacterized protein LOC123702874 n=1 Tax=Colias crocea TaxID=72248 RepID=UPI001E279F40|nr:uncharacterized protein LOC123702874 [Colias croceus]
MLHLLLLLNVFSLSCSNELIQNASVFKENQNNGVAPFVSLRNSMVVPNKTFIDKSDNILRIPKPLYQENKRKKIKKSPKRTVQKIIKKNRMKHRQIYVQPATRSPTISTVYENNEKNFQSGQSEDKYTTEANQRRRPKKNSKVLRNYMPFQKLQTRNMRRNKRDTERSDVYILKDLDEIEFLGSDKDYDVVNAHVKNYW